jgi:hypothetical protein
VTNATFPRHGEQAVFALTCVSWPVTLGIPQLAPTDSRGAGLTLSLGKAVAVLRAKVRRLEQELEELRAQRDAAIAHELLSLAGDNAEPALA